MTTTSPNKRLEELTQKLRQMRLPIIAAQLRAIYTEKSVDSITPLDLLEQMVTEEFYTRKQNAIDRNRKKAKLSNTTAHLRDIHHSPERKINAQVLEQLATNQYIYSQRNVIIQGATGTGKSYMANALANHALEASYTVRYFRMTELLNELHLAELEHEMVKRLKQLTKVDILVIDDFLLTPTSELEQKYLMEVFELRNRSKPLILCSQMSTAEWHKKLGGGAIADAILDRAISNAYQLIIEGSSQRRAPSTGSKNND